MPRRADPTLRAAWLLGALASLAPPAHGQVLSEPPLVLRATFAAAPDLAEVPALQWWLGTHLPTTAAWPRDLPAGSACTLVWTADTDRWSVRAASVPPPRGAVAAGAVGIGDRDLVWWQCAADGVEDWHVPPDAEPPTRWLPMLRDLALHTGGAPRSFDLAVLVGHLAGPRVAEDSTQQALQIAAALCGHVTLTVWNEARGLRVRGRSDGGLLLPAWLVHRAAGGSGRTQALALRAFAARDGDREEAARQLGRLPAARATPALRALLHGDDELRLAAIDSLVRCGAVDQLPAIVAAAGDDAPWASVAATDAVQALWDAAPPSVRQRTRAAIARSQHAALLALPLAPRPVTAIGDGRGGDPHARLLVVLGLSAVLLYGFWLRERARLADATG